MQCSKKIALVGGLFDHLVGEREQLIRDAEAKRLGYDAAFKIALPPANVRIR